MLFEIKNKRKKRQTARHEAARILVHFNSIWFSTGGGGGGGGGGAKGLRALIELYIMISSKNWFQGHLFAFSGKVFINPFNPSVQ